MQSPMFVFTGLRDQRSTGDTNLLLTRLHQSFAVKQIPISFTKKDELLTSRFDDVSFYIAFMKDKTELKDWLQMAKDFELTSKANPIDSKGLEKRYHRKKKNSPDLYKEIHYSIGEIIFTEMNKFLPVEIYFFH
jgi:hypothetical protein